MPSLRLQTTKDGTYGQKSCEFHAKACAGENPYSFTAQLQDVHTEGHIDRTDARNGLPGGNYIGNFTGRAFVSKVPLTDCLQEVPSVCLSSASSSISNLALTIILVAPTIPVMS